jgi:hypothetical protein
MNGKIKIELDREDFIAIGKFLSNEVDKITDIIPVLNFLQELQNAGVPMKELEGERMSDTIKVCRDCRYHSEADRSGRVDVEDSAVILQDLTPYAHYCTATKQGHRKIKLGTDFNGAEQPKWCPLITGKVRQSW